MKHEPRRVFAYCGHEHVNKRAATAASTVTVRHYQLSSDEGANRLRAIDLIARHDMGSLLDEPDTEDLLEVIQFGDPDWMLPEDAASRIGMNFSNVYMNIKRGRLEVKTVWLADGGYTTHSADDRNPAIPRTVISVESVDRFIAQRSRPTVAQAAALLGMTTPTIRSNYLNTGLLPYDELGSRLRVDSVVLAQIHTSLLDGVMAILHRHGPLTSDALRDRFNASKLPMLANGTVKRDWIERWTSQLITQKRVKRRLNG